MLPGCNHQVGWRPLTDAEGSQTRLPPLAQASRLPAPLPERPCTGKSYAAPCYGSAPKYISVHARSPTYAPPGHAQRPLRFVTKPLHLQRLF